MNYQDELFKTIGLKLDNNTEAKDILFFSGAGISVPPPTNFTIGKDLYRMVWEHAGNKSKEEIIKLSKELVFEETISRLSKFYKDVNGEETRLQCGFVSHDEVKKICAFIGSQKCTNDDQLLLLY